MADPIELGRRLSKNKHFQWKPGMVAMRVDPPEFFSEGADPYRLVGQKYLVILVRAQSVQCYGECFRTHHPAYVPDVTDPGTRGHLLERLREVWGTPSGILAPLDKGRWAWKVPDILRSVAVTLRGDSEAEALTLAFEGVP